MVRKLVRRDGCLVINHRPKIALLFIFLAIGASGCTRALRGEAKKVATAGTTTANHLGEYYDSLARDTIKTWELNAFSDAYSVAEVETKFDRDIAGINEQLRTETRPAEIERLKSRRASFERTKRELLQTPVSPQRRQRWQRESQSINQELQAESAKAEKDQNKGVIRALTSMLKQKQELIRSESDQEAIYTLYRQRYEALRARKKMVAGLQSMYEQFASLADYNAAEDVRAKANELVGALGGVLDAPLPDLTPTGNSLIGRVIGDVIQEIETVQQNKAILKGSRRVVEALRHLQTFFDSEKVVYQSIPTIRASFARQITKNLLENSSVISTSLLNDLLTTYDLRWPDPQVPFTAKAMIRGVQGMIDARSKPLEKASQDTADGLSSELTKLISLHEELAEERPLSFVEFAETSSSVQLLLEELKARDIPANEVLNILKSLAKEKQK